jgi:adenylate kinase family enzyme
VIDGSPPAKVVVAGLQAQFPAMPARKSAEPTVRRARRISVVGATGSGKTILARQLAERLNLPHCELDQIRHAVDQGSSEQSFQRLIAELAGGEEWIIDGHYREVRHLIWRHAEVVVWLNYPLRIVALRVIERFRRKLRARASRTDRFGEVLVAARHVAHEGASWRRRLGRLVRTLRERSVYGRLLRSRHYPNLRTVELRSIEATAQWLRDL